MEAEAEAVALLRRALKEVSKIGTSSVGGELKELRRNFNQFETKLSQVYDDRLSGLINAELCKKKMSELEEQQQGIKARIEALERETHRVIQDGYKIVVPINLFFELWTGKHTSFFENGGNGPDRAPDHPQAPVISAFVLEEKIEFRGSAGLDFDIFELLRQKIFFNIRILTVPRGWSQLGLRAYKPLP